MSIITKLLGAGQNKLLKGYKQSVEKINQLESSYKAMSDSQLVEKAASLRNQQSLSQDDVNNALALGRENIRRQTGQRAYDVQLIAALALGDGHISEALTGEGKSLISRLAIIINVLKNEQTHVITVNEYLASRDAEDCRRCIGNLGISVGLVFSQQSPMSKKQAYSCDVVYGTPSEFGFDYLRDNMAKRMSDKVQQGHHAAIIDEVDSILIDDARTPLIIAGPGSTPSEVYMKFADIVPRLREGVDYEVDEKNRQISATESGLAKVESALGIDDLYSDLSGQMAAHFMNALKAQFLFHIDQDYIVDDGEVKIVDPNTGRVMEGRRWSEGLHQAVEAKEHVAIQEENQTIATVTLQNYFRLYDKLSGMTGTAMTEDAEFRKVYDMGVVPVPPNKPVQRVDEDDVVYRNEKYKFDAVVEEIKEAHEKGQPLLVGTASVETSERLSRLLDKQGLKHNVLNAKNHRKEASIVAQAGRFGAITIATNMAGRGTDILLGGNPEGLVKDEIAAIIASREPDPETGEVDEYIPQADIDEIERHYKELCAEEQTKVIEAGGLYVIGTERHESRRIDNQLRGRSGRQGDPGRSRFFISLEDTLMRRFGQEMSDNVNAVLDKLSIPDDEPIESPMVTKAIEKAQRNVEAINAEQRKNTLEYDDVMDKQRKAIYAEREIILSGKPIDEKIELMKNSLAEEAVNEFCDPELAFDDWDFDGLRQWFCDITGVTDEQAAELIDPSDELFQDPVSAQGTLYEVISALYDARVQIMGEDSMTAITRDVMLKVLDAAWMDHLLFMDYLKSGVGLRGIGQKDPLTEYKQESYGAFGYMVDAMYRDVMRTILRLKIAVPKITLVPDETNPNEIGAELGEASIGNSELVTVLH